MYSNESVARRDFLVIRYAAKRTALMTCRVHVCIRSLDAKRCDRKVKYNNNFYT